MASVQRKPSKGALQPALQSVSRRNAFNSSTQRAQPHTPPETKSGELKLTPSTPSVHPFWNPQFPNPFLARVMPVVTLIQTPSSPQKGAKGTTVTCLQSTHGCDIRWRQLISSQGFWMQSTVNVCKSERVCGCECGCECERARSLLRAGAGPESGPLHPRLVTGPARSCS